MPKRKNIRRVPSDAVQGPDSWVEVSRPLFGDGRRARSTDATDEKSSDDYARDFLASHILDWNWVDDGGQPLPQVKEDASVLEKLTDQEIDFITEAISGPTADEVKS
jgi:hypothetical protein